MSPLPSGPTTETHCPRCAARFGCAAKTWGCWCGKAPLDAEVRSQLAAQYEGCLCPDCLRELAPAK